MTTMHAFLPHFKNWSTTWTQFPLIEFLFSAQAQNANEEQERRSKYVYLAVQNVAFWQLLATGFLAFRSMLRMKMGPLFLRVLQAQKPQS